MITLCACAAQRALASIRHHEVDEWKRRQCKRPKGEKATKWSIAKRNDEKSVCASFERVRERESNAMKGEIRWLWERRCVRARLRYLLEESCRNVNEDFFILLTMFVGTRRVSFIRKVFGRKKMWGYDSSLSEKGYADRRAVFTPPPPPFATPTRRCFLDRLQTT